ncbi:hypothetical protein DPMN_016031 [Dreissena polymorpha]|uniref:Uncharacterized protein n=1 Tax=Dreissena polymorpha TaxID=45954 RepID=A0A9D4NC51_DREPO|nr:hypothetical protein DPMN_016031 [Dreissena polymorpha]
MALFIQSLPNVKLDLDIVQTNILDNHVIQLTRTIFELNKSHIKETNVLTKFHENWAKNVTSRKNAPPTGGHVFSPIWTIFELVRDINQTNVLTNFHDDWAKIVISRPNKENCPPPPPPGSHETNVLTKFHDNWAKKVSSRVFTCFHYLHIEKNAPPTGGHVFSPIWTIYELFRDINKTNVLTNFHNHWAKIVTSRVFTSHVIKRTRTIFELNSHIKETNVLTKFHENWAKNVTSRKNAPPTGGHVFSPIWTIFELVRDINQTNVLTNFHDDWAKIVISRVFTRKTAPPPGSHETNVLTKFHDNWAKKVSSRRKMPRPLAAMFFSPIWTIYELFRDINKTNVLTNFHNHWAKIVTSRVFTSHVIKRTGTIFELNSHIKETNVLTKFHENWAKNVTSRVFTCFHYIHIEKNAPPTGCHVFSPIWTIFELVRDINKTNVLTNFHDDWAKIVTSRVKTARPTGGHVFQRTGTTFELDQHIIKANILTNFEVDRDIIVTNLLTNFHEDPT